MYINVMTIRKMLISYVNWIIRCIRLTTDFIKLIVVYISKLVLSFMFDDHYLMHSQVPIFTRKEEIFDNLCEKDVPVSRAAWYIKVFKYICITPFHFSATIYYRGNNRFYFFPSR
jgi:hypothetical protein